MAREFFCSYHSTLEAMEHLNDAERGRLFTACLLYSKTGEAPELRGNERFVFSGLKAQIDRDKEKYSKRHREGIPLLSHTGEKHWNWKGGITSTNQKERRSIRYKEWRQRVFRRDRYTCQRCFQKGGILNAHHKEPWAANPEKRFDISNGITLCSTCHKKEHGETL